jgi:hypothetical protein
MNALMGVLRSDGGASRAASYPSPLVLAVMIAIVVPRFGVHAESGHRRSDLGRRKRRTGTDAQPV